MRTKIMGMIKSTKNYLSSQILSVKKFRKSKYRNGFHVANKKYKDGKGRIVAVRCDCEKNTFHPVLNGIVIWTIKTTVHHIIPIKKRKGSFRPSRKAV